MERNPGYWSVDHQRRQAVLERPVAAARVQPGRGLFAGAKRRLGVVETPLYEASLAATMEDSRLRASSRMLQAICMARLLYGGADAVGVAYQLTQKNGTWHENVIHTFATTDGKYPLGTPVINGDALFGTTQVGGSSNGGVIWQITAK